MINLIALWDEVSQKAGNYNDNNHKTYLRFPKKITLSGTIFDEIEIETKRDCRGCINRIFYGDKVVREDQPRKGAVWDIHADILNYLRGEYVKQHKNNLRQ
ncbi:MAG: hypothetical protein WC584_03215 [Candidatus Pacearchaeota archaeon]